MTDETPVSTEQDKLIAQTLLKESDRGCVIMGAALVAEALEDVIRSFCRQSPDDQATIASLFQGYAPLATFAARIQIAFALALLPRELRSKIDIIRRLRNEFAHEWGPIDFTDPRCADRLALLIGRPSREPGAQAESGTPMGPPGPTATKEQMIERLVFVMCVVRIIARLGVLAELAREGKDIRRIVLAQDEEAAAKA